MFKLLLPLSLFFSGVCYTQSLTQEEAKALVRTLSTSKRDTGQINSLLKLAKYQIFKPGENKDDLDSAADFIAKAENINSNIKSNWAEGYILLIKSYLLHESGKEDEGKESAGKAVDILKKETDKSLAG